MKISDKTDLSYKDGYYLVSKLKETVCEKSKQPYLRKCITSTFAKLTGAERQLLEYNEDITNLGQLAEEAKQEFYLYCAIQSSKVKQRNKED